MNTPDYSPCSTRFALSDAERAGFDRIGSIVREHTTTGDEPLPLSRLEALFRALAPTGYLASTLSKADGGHGLSPPAFGAFVEALAPALTLLGNHSVQRYLADFGTAAQKSRFLPSLLDGTGIGAIAITEPNAGSDLSAMQTVATREGTSFRLNGCKTWVTHGMVATVFIVLTRTGGNQNGFTRFIVPGDTPGLSRRALSPIGLHHLTFAEVTLNDCVVPDSHCLGEEGRGAEGTKTAFPLARALAALQSLRIAESAVNIASEYAHTRKILGEPLAHRELIKDGRVRLATSIDGLRLLGYRALSDLSASDRQGGASAVKAAASDLAIEACVWSAEVLGSEGLATDHPINRLLNDARMMSVVDGTAVLNRLVVARRTRHPGGAPFA